MVRQDSKRSCWTSPKGHHNRWSLIAVVANQAVAFDKSMLMACHHLGDEIRPGLIRDHGQTGQKQKGWTSRIPHPGNARVGVVLNRYSNSESCASNNARNAAGLRSSIV